MISYDMVKVLSASLMTVEGWGAAVRCVSRPDSTTARIAVVDLLAERIRSIADCDDDQLTDLWRSCGYPNGVGQRDPDTPIMARITEALVDYVRGALVVSDVSTAAHLLRMGSCPLRVGDCVVTDGVVGAMPYTYMCSGQDWFAYPGDVDIARDIPWRLWGDLDPGLWRVTGFRRSGSKVLPGLEPVEPAGDNMPDKLSGAVPAS